MPDQPERKTRCRMHDRRNNPCPNESLTDPQDDLQICLSHATQAIDLVRELRTAIFEGTHQ